jgi:hypothetical protein
MCEMSPRRRARRRLALWVSAAVLALGASSGGAAASPAIRLTIQHVFQNCHVWAEAAGRTFGPSLRETVKRGTRVVIRSDCPMDFDFVQTRGPRLALGDPRTYAGTTRVLVFRKPGVYRLRVTNVQTPEERGLQTIGEPNTLTLTVVVR